MARLSFTGTLIACPVCGSKDHDLVSQTDRHGQPLKTVLCCDCGHVFTNPQPTAEELKTFYGERYRESYKGVHTPKRKHIYRAGMRALERLSHLTAFCPSGSRVLDIGSGGGEFVYLLQKAGFKCSGVEPNHGYGEFSKTTYGIEVGIDSLEDLTLDQGQWDGITLHHVLEHLADPIAALKRLAEALDQNGKVIVEVPNVEARYHGPGRQFHLAHLHTFSIDGLEAAGARAGLTAVNKTLQPHTRHIRTVFAKGDAVEKSPPEKSTAQKIREGLKTYTPARDLLTARPYRRLWANLKRPVKENLALLALGNPKGAKDILDRLYEKEAGEFLVNQDL